MSDPARPYDEMAVRDEHVPAEIFSSFVERMPQVCVELVLETARGILLVKRDIEPAIWFWPGTRLYKGEALEDAAHRLAGEELSIDVTLLDRYGPYAHFWRDSAVAGSPSRHTVNVVFHAQPTNPGAAITLDDQHSAYRFITEPEADLHEYVTRYLTDNDLL